MTNANEISLRTRAQRRILALVEQRPGLLLCYIITARGGYYSLHDEAEALWESRCAFGTIDGLITGGMVPQAVLDRSSLHWTHRQ